MKVQLLTVWPNYEGKTWEQFKVTKECNSVLTAMTAVSGNTATRLQNMRPLKDYHHHEKQKIRCDKAGLAFTAEASGDVAVADGSQG
ncbi:TPA: hypothetical protein ACH3X2_013338 [Trebouxia sp. C0005]